MEKNFIIQMVSRIKSEQSDDTIKIKEDCFFEKRGDNYYIIFDQKEEDNSKIRTTIIVKNDVVSLNRGGGETGNIRLLQNDTTYCKYPTAMGLLDLEVFTKKIDRKMSDKEAKLRLRYLLKNDSQLLAENDISIDITERK